MRQTKGFSHRHFRDKSGSRLWRGRSFYFPLTTFLIMVVLISMLAIGWKRRANAPELEGYTKATLAGQHFLLEEADTPQMRTQGLSGRARLPDKQGMVFIFSQPLRACFWMKDMQFSIDILWFDASQKLIHQQLDVRPDSYPTEYCPPRESKYVVELNAGEARSLNLKLGDMLTLEKQ